MKCRYTRHCLSIRKEGGLHNNVGDSIGINVGGRTAILVIAFALNAHMARNTDRGTTVSNAVAEVVNVSRLVSACETLIVVLAIHCNVLCVAEAQLLDGVFNRFNAAFLTHGLGREVGVASSTVPVALDGLGMNGHDNAEIFRDALQDVASNPEVVSHINAKTRTYLELKLTWSDFSIDTRNVDASIETGSVVRFHNITAKDLACTNTTIVLAL